LGHLRRRMAAKNFETKKQMVRNLFYGIILQVDYLNVVAA